MKVIKIIIAAVLSLPAGLVAQSTPAGAPAEPGGTETGVVAPRALGSIIPADGEDHALRERVLAEVVPLKEGAMEILNSGEAIKKRRAARNPDSPPPGKEEEAQALLDAASTASIGLRNTEAMVGHAHTLRGMLGDAQTQLQERKQEAGRLHQEAGARHRQAESEIEKNRATAKSLAAALARAGVSKEEDVPKDIRQATVRLDEAQREADSARRTYAAEEAGHAQALDELEAADKSLGVAVGAFEELEGRCSSARKCFERIAKTCHAVGRSRLIADAYRNTGEIAGGALKAAEALNDVWDFLPSLTASIAPERRTGPRPLGPSEASPASVFQILKNMTGDPPASAGEVVR